MTSHSGVQWLKSFTQLNDIIENGQNHFFICLFAKNVAYLDKLLLATTMPMCCHYMTQIKTNCYHGHTSQTDRPQLNIFYCRRFYTFQCGYVKYYTFFYCKELNIPKMKTNCVFQAALVFLLRSTAGTGATGGSTSSLTSTSSSDWPLRRSFTSSERPNVHTQTQVCTYRHRCAHTRVCINHLPTHLWGRVSIDLARNTCFVYNIISRLYHHVELIYLLCFLKCLVFIRMWSENEIKNKIFVFF